MQLKSLKVAKKQAQIDPVAQVPSLTGLQFALPCLSPAFLLLPSYSGWLSPDNLSMAQGSWGEGQEWSPWRRPLKWDGFWRENPHSSHWTVSSLRAGTSARISLCIPRVPPGPQQILNGGEPPAWRKLFSTPPSSGAWFISQKQGVLWRDIGSYKVILAFRGRYYFYKRQQEGGNYSKIPGLGHLGVCGWVPAFSSSCDPGVLGSSPTLGSHRERTSLSAYVSASLCVSLLNK